MLARSLKSNEQLTNLTNGRIARRILVLSSGGIREEGTHRELLSLAGQYTELFQLQAVGYG